MTKKFRLNPLWLLSACLPFWLCSCATPLPPQAFHNTDGTALIVKSLDNRSCDVIAPMPMGSMENVRVLTQVRGLAQHQTAVVILENYSEPKVGPQFRARAVAWFIGLRGLGYQNIFFLQGQGVTNPEGLPILASYN